jgi:hypothetical protein
MKRIFIINIVLFILILSVATAQQTIVVEKDTIYYNEFVGREIFSLKEMDSIFLKEGKYEFRSTLFNRTLSNQLSKLFISGNFKSGRYNGIWEYRLVEYDLEIHGLKDGRIVGLDYELNGIERSAKFNYVNGLPIGEWKIDNIIVERNRKASESSGAQFYFKDGLAVGDFYFNGVVSKSSLKGKLTDEGFLDGILTISYVEDGVQKREIRNYENGFLTVVEVFIGNQLQNRVVYEDVIEKLKEKEENKQSLNFTISDEGFGFVFQNGYNPSDDKLKIQEQGSLVFKRVLDRYQRFSSNAVDEREVPRFNFTRRFKFVYPESEKEIISQIKPTLNIMLDEYNSFLSNPKFILNRYRIDSMPYIFGFVDHSRRKVQDMLDVISLSEEGFFDFLYRPNYFPEGLPNLKKSDFFRIEENGKEIEVPYDLGVYVNDPEILIEQIKIYTEVLKQKTDGFLDYAFMQIKIFDEQATIDSLDSQIVQLRNKVEALYSFQQLIPQGKSFEQMDLDYKLLRILDSNSLIKLQADYLDSDKFEEKVEMGIRLTCILQELIDSHDFILEIEEMPKRLDTQFTRYSPNPFFERDIETKILPHIYGKGTGPLLREYIENLFRSRTCRELKANLEKIEKLEKRLIELSKRSNEEEIGRLDRALRRENIPSRIERLLIP